MSVQQGELLGRIRDVDTHEMFPARRWVAEYGDVVAPIADFFLKAQSEHVPNSFAVQRDTDTSPIEKEHLLEYWGEGCLAPGAYDMQRRLAVMDMAGIKDSLIFGSMMAILGQQYAIMGGRMGGDLGEAMAFDPFEMGRAMLRAHNDWCVRVANMSSRLRPVPVLLTDNLRQCIDESERLIAAGVRAISIPTGLTIEGKAPAHPDNDALWEVFAKNNVALLFHIGGEHAFLREQAGWVNAPQFYSNNTVPTELPVDPLSLATCNLAAQSYMTNLVFGGVFERVPTLRCGFMELGAHWVGPTGQNMDMWADQFAKRFRGQLSLKPSEYIRRNIRVSPFTFEPVDEYIDHFPYLADVFCFSTDYPHYEGGKTPISGMAARVKRLGADVAEKFFTGNAEWVMPS